MQQYNKYIAKLVLVPIALIILLSINFMIWGGYCSKDSVEYGIHQEMQLIEESNASANNIDEMTDMLTRLLVIAVVRLILSLSYIQTKSTITYDRSKEPYQLNTLFALSVRLNN